MPRTRSQIRKYTGSRVRIDKKVTLEVEEEEDDDEEAEIVHEEHIRITTEIDWNAENIKNFCISTGIHIKQEIDFEDNYIEGGEFIDIGKIKTEVDSDVEENEIGIGTEEIESSMEDEEANGERIGEEITKDWSIEEKGKKDRIREETTKDASMENERANEERIEEKAKDHHIEEEIIKQDKIQEEETKGARIEYEKAIEERIDVEKPKKSCIEEEKNNQNKIQIEITKDASTEEQNIENGLQEEETEDGSVGDVEMQEDRIIDKRIEPESVEGDKTEVDTVKKDIVKEIKPIASAKKAKPVPEDSQKITLNRDIVYKTKPQNTRPPPHHNAKPHSTNNKKEVWRKPFNTRDKWKRHQAHQNDDKFWNHSRKSPSGSHRTRRCRLGSKFFDNKRQREMRTNQIWNTPSVPNQCQNSSPDWQTYSTILGVLNQVLGQQMAQSSQVGGRSLVPYVQERMTHKMRRKKRFEVQNRPTVWASGFDSCATVPSFETPAQLQTYTTILQAVSQLNNSGAMLNQNVQTSFSNVFRS